MPSESIAQPRPIEFVHRSSCPLCGKSDYRVVWSGGFADANVQSFLERFHYAGDALQHLKPHRFELVQCGGCEFKYQRVILDEASSKRLYSEWINEDQIEAFEAHFRGTRHTINFEDARQLTKHVLRLEKLLRSAFKTEPLRILDYGCGDARLLQLASLFGFETFGIDFSTTRQARIPESVTVRGSLEELTAGGFAPVHVITLMQVMEHVTEPRTLLESLILQLRPGGILIIEVPTTEDIEVPSNFDQFQRAHPLEHLNCFTPDSLRRLGENLGLKWIQRPPAHVTTRPEQILKTEASRFIRRPRTEAYFQKPGL